MAFKKEFNSNKQEYKISTTSFVDEVYEDAVLDDNDPIHEIKQLAGIIGNPAQLFNYSETKNIPVYNNSVTEAQEKIQYQNDNNIQPGTPAWFALWFAKPGITGENPFK